MVLWHYKALHSTSKGGQADVTVIGHYKGNVIQRTNKGFIVETLSASKVLCGGPDKELIVSGEREAGRAQSARISKDFGTDRHAAESRVDVGNTGLLVPGGASAMRSQHTEKVGIMRRPRGRAADAASAKGAQGHGALPETIGTLVEVLAWSRAPVETVVRAVAVDTLDSAVITVTVAVLFTEEARSAALRRSPPTKRAGTLRWK
ncbi:hypothetical protein FPV67DRAFT_1461212 [Lyophyllum atratum]|nr:hypothetical protein FPV67DRAFT_1461212 [Lyophyllum atratum]